MDHLVVFARWPELGTVKTRLSPALPPELALGLHEAMLRDALAAGAASAAAQRHLCWADAPAAPRRSVAAGYHERPQRGNDLGARLEFAFDELLGGPADRVVVIGADCPDLTGTIIDEAFDRLAESDLVLGPTLDGGYYLIGMRRRAPKTLFGVEWGSSQVLAQTMERARASGLTTAMLQVLEDVDTAQDLVNLAVRCFERGAPTPRHTTQALERLGLLPGFRR